MPSSASSFNFLYPIVFLRSSNSCLHCFPCLLVTSIPPSIFSSVTCFRSHFLRNMWPIQLAFLLFIVCTIFLSSLTVCNTASFLTRSAQLAGEKSLLPIECCFCHGNHVFNCTCASYIFCYHATQTVEILHILQLFLMYHNLYWGWLPWDSHCLHLRTINVVSLYDYPFFREGEHTHTQLMQSYKYNNIRTLISYFDVPDKYW